MFRPILSYTLASLILLSQIGLPMHLHYCKGILEAISVFVQPECNDHQEIADLPFCCQKDTNTCAKEEGKCCDDELKVLTQDITSIQPHFTQWADFILVSEANGFSVKEVSVENVNEISFLSGIQDTGPPIYILHQALIYYA